MAKAGSCGALTALVAPFDNQTTKSPTGGLIATVGTHCVSTLHVAPCKIEAKGKKDLKLLCLTVIAPATGWFKMCQI
jgi:hypothetical protein